MDVNFKAGVSYYWPVHERTLDKGFFVTISDPCNLCYTVFTYSGRLAGVYGGRDFIAVRQKNAIPGVPEFVTVSLRLKANNVEVAGDTLILYIC